MKKFLHYLLSTVFMLSLVSVAVCQEPDEAPEPASQSKMIAPIGSNVISASLAAVPVTVTVFDIQQHPAALVAIAYDDALKPGWCVLLKINAKADSKRMTATPWMHRCSRMC